MMDDDFDRLTEGHHSPGVEVAVVVRYPDGVETTAAVFHDASVVLESAPETPEWIGSHVTRPHQYRTAYQMRVTTTAGLTLYDSSFFARHTQIEIGEQ